MAIRETFVISCPVNPKGAGYSIYKDNKDKAAELLKRDLLEMINKNPLVKIKLMTIVDLKALDVRIDTEEEGQSFSSNPSDTDPAPGL